MKVLNLRCDHGHSFEGWFASEDDYQSQAGRGLVACPLCGNEVVSKMPSAPRLNLSGAARPSSAAGQAQAHAQTNASEADLASSAGKPSATQTSSAALVPADIQALWLKTLHQVMSRTEDVGDRFPEEARRMHYGETPDRGIRGRATSEEREALADEGIDVVPLPMPPGLKGPVQ